MPGEAFPSMQDNGVAMQDNGAAMQDNGAAMQDNGVAMQDNAAAMQDNGGTMQEKPVLSACPENVLECRGENRFQCEAFRALPRDLQDEFRRLKRRSGHGVLADLICRVCGVRQSTRSELVCFLGRNETYVRGILKRLLMEGRIAYSIPDMPKHPKQSYWVSPRT